MKNWMLRIIFFLLMGAAIIWIFFPDGYALRGPLLDSMLGREAPAPTQEMSDGRLRAPDGYDVTLWAQNLGDARFLRVTPEGSLLVSQTRLGQISLVLADHDGDGLSDGSRVIVENLDRPHGFDLREGSIYIGEATAIARVPFEESGLDTISLTGEVERIAEGIPEGGNHWRRSLRFGPDGRIYVTVGSSCNVCEEEDPRRAALLRFEADGSGETTFATGLRNTVGFDWQPGTDALYGTDNGRDLLGDDEPACELNHIIEDGFYGWPYANANANSQIEADPDFGPGNEDRIADSLAPAHSFRAHNAPLGITFIRRRDADPAYRGAALVALHGSWNRSTLDGYQVVSLHWGADGQITERPFLTGFEENGDVMGRPVDIAEGTDGAIYISDDYGKAVYRVSRHDSNAPSLKRPNAFRAATATPRTSGFTAGERLDDLSPTNRVALEERGGEIFKEKACATCHIASESLPGVSLKKLENLRSRYNIDELAIFFAAPQPPMPIVDLSEAQRRALAVYVLSTYGD
ncbi:MAG: oxidoreductase [Deltaproteobacteria bacterium]|nr:oxidoreductase [Deltaproteobacteria bacterium]